MPLSATHLPAIPDDDRKAVGFWMTNAKSDSPIRVFVTYEALWQIDPSQVHDVASAVSTCNANRARLEEHANRKFDADSMDEGQYKGQPILFLRSMDVI
jgi:hypothetical protein